MRASRLYLLFALCLLCTRTVAQISSPTGVTYIPGVPGPAVYIAPQAQADVALNGAISLLASQGGGTLVLGAGTYTLANPVALKSGVYVQGATALLNYTTNSAPIPDSNLVLANGGGTIFNCNAGACFQWNKAVLGVPGSANAFVLLGITNAGIRNIGFTNCSRAIDAGNTNNPAGWYLEFDNLYAAACTDWGFWITNFQHVKFRRIFTFGNVNGGQFYGNDVPQATLQPGNSVWEDIYNTTPSTNANLSRGLVWFITQGQQNQGQLYRVQSNRLNSSVITQAATMANTSANIGVTDVSKFPVGMPVTFSATANGFVQNEIYFVITNPGGSGVGNITVALTFGGTAITATGNTAVNIIEQGYAAVEVIAQSGAALSAHEFYDMDVEAGGTCAIITQNVQTSSFNISQVPLSAQATQSFCARNLTFSQVFSRASSNTSWDGSSGSSHFYGSRAAGSTGGGAVAHNPPGIYFDAGLGYTVMNLTASVMGWSNQTPDTTNMLIPLTGAVQQVKSKAATAVTIVGSDSGWVVDTLTTGLSTFTLPTVSSTIKTMQYVFINPVGTGQNLAITSTSNFCGPATARTTITMTPGSAFMTEAENDALGSYYACGPMLGSYAAGTLTGITP